MDNRCIYNSRFRMAGDRQWAHSSIPKTNSCVQPALLRWIEGWRGGEAGFHGLALAYEGNGWLLPKVALSCLRRQNKAAHESISHPEGEVYPQHRGLNVRCVYVPYHTWPGGIHSKQTPLHSLTAIGDSSQTGDGSLCVGRAGSAFVQACVSDSSPCHPHSHTFALWPVWGLGLVQITLH